MDAASEILTWLDFCVVRVIEFKAYWKGNLLRPQLLNNSTLPTAFSAGFSPPIAVKMKPAGSPEPSAARRGPAGTSPP